jgi:DNA-binding MarR family transcriptional regulator
MTTRSSFDAETTDVETTDVETTDVAVLAHELRLLAGALHRRVRGEAGTGRLTATQFSLLARLERDGTASPGELAAAEGITTQAIGQGLSVLAAEGLVARRPHPSDGRQVLAEPTEAGSKLVAEDRRSRESWIAQALGSLDHAELQHVAETVRLLSRFVATSRAGVGRQ